MLWPRTKPPADFIKRFSLQEERIYLRPSMDIDREEWLALRAKNETYLRPYEPAWPDDALSPAFFERRLARLQQDWIEDRSYAFLIFAREDDAMIGGMNINNVTRGAAQYATLGYWIDEEYQGQGLMKEAGHAALHYAFHSALLSRMNAACLPRNDRSKNLLLSLGFTEEGFAKAYIQINGRREDHILFGLNASDFSRAA